MAASIYNLLKFYGTSVYALAGFQLSARIAWGTTWDCTTWVICHKHFSRKSQCCGWTSPSDSYYDCRMLLSNNYQEILKNKFYYSHVLEGTQYAQGHTAKSNRKTERKQQHGVLPLLGSWGHGVGSPGFCGFTLY